MVGPTAEKAIKANGPWFRGHAGPDCSIIQTSQAEQPRESALAWRGGALEASHSTLDLPCRWAENIKAVTQKAWP